MKKLFALLLVFAMTLTVASCSNNKEATESQTGDASSNPQSAQDGQESGKDADSDEIGVINVGTDGAYYPYCYVDEKDGELKGFEVELFEKIGEYAGVEVNIEVVKWQGIFGMLDSGRIDTIACQMSITEERQKTYDFSDPYMYTGLRVAVQEGKEDTIKTLDDLKGKRIACNTGGNSYTTLSEAQEKVDFEIVPYDASGMEYDLSLGRVDGLYQSAIATMGVKEKGEFKIAFADLEPLAYEVNCYPLRKDERSAKIIEKINQALADMRTDGTLKELSMKWFQLDLTEESK